MVCNSISIVACAWLLCRLVSLPAHLRRRHQPLLMTCLAGSDLTFHTCALMLVALTASGREPTDSLWLRGAAMGIALSAWLVLAVCLGYLVQSTGEGHGIVPWLPLLALMATVLTTSQLFKGPLIGQLGAEVVIVGATLLITSLLSMACLVVAVVRSRASGDVVKARCFLRAAAFATNALLTELPLTVVCTAKVILKTSGHGPLPPSCFAFAFALVSLSGTANGCTFFCQSRYSNSAIQDVAQLSTVRSAQVRLNNNVEEIPV